MIEEQELLQRAWIELAVFTEQQRPLREAIGLPRTVQSEISAIAYKNACSSLFCTFFKLEWAVSSSETFSRSSRKSLARSIPF